MRRQTRGNSGRGLGSRARRWSSLYLLGFLLAVAATPHRHLNSIEDLVSEGRSDSGFFLETAPPDAGGEARVQAARLVDDDPCLACFHHDYSASMSAVFVLDQAFTALRSVPAPPALGVPEPVFESPASRSPPGPARSS